MPTSNYDTEISVRTEAYIKYYENKRRGENLLLGFMGRFDEGGDT